MTFSPDCAYLATLGMDKNLRVWNVHTGKQVHSLETSINIGDERAEQIIAVGNGGQAHVMMAGSIAQIAISRDNRFLAALGQHSTVSLLEMATGKGACRAVSAS